MSGETESRPSGWTIDTIKEYVDQRYIASDKAIAAALAAQKEAIAAALTAADKAGAKAETASEKRFDSVNEFRAQQADIIATFMPRTEAQVLINSIADKLDLQAARLDKLEGRSSGIGWVGALVVGGVAVLGTIIIVANLLTGGP